MTTVLALDQGTSATKALVVSDDGDVLAAAESPVAPRYGDGGLVQQDPGALLESVLDAGRRAVTSAGVPIDAVGLANQGETVLAWDPASGEPLTSAIVWQDRRSAGICERLAPHAARLAEITGLTLDPYFAAPKLAWLREHVTREGVATTSDAWLAHRLTGAFATDASTASRTLLLDLDGVAWSEEALRVFGLEREALPRIAACDEVVGETTAFGPAAPLTALVVDQQAALFAESCFEAGEAKCTYGTGAFLLATAGARGPRSHAGLTTSVAWRLRGETTYCLDGQVYTVGSAVRWLADLGVLPDPGAIDELGASVPDAGGVVLVPALAGLASPWWEPEARGSIHGLGLDTTRAHVVRALVEGIAASVVELARAVARDLGRELTVLRIDGGLTRSRLLAQTQADLLQAPVEVFASPDATALGTAALARLGADPALAPRDAVVPGPPPAVFEPAMSADEAATRLARFEAAVAATRARAR